MVRAVTNVFWFAFLVEGLVSLADEAFFTADPHSPLFIARASLAAGVVLLSLVVAFMVAFTPRAPKRVLVPMLFFTWWVDLAQAFPLGYLKIPQFMLWMSLGQVTLAIMLFLFFRVHGVRWPFVKAERPAFLWKHALIAAPVMAIAFTVTAVLTVFTGLSGQLETISGGYVKLRPDGIYLLERRFQSGDKEVRLSGMIHIAEEEFYSNLLPDADPKTPSVVLIEGVTDQDNLLGEEGLSYSRLASMLSISSQEDSDFMQKVSAGLRRHREHAAVDQGEWEENLKPAEPGSLDFVHADVDVNTFHPKTVAFIVAVMSVFQSDDLSSALKKFTETSSPLNDQKSQEQVIQDILYSRNNRLTSEIETSLKDYKRVIIPWGALHLTGIESWLRKHDFVQSGETERKALGFW